MALELIGEPFGMTWARSTKTVIGFLVAIVILLEISRWGHNFLAETAMDRLAPLDAWIRYYVLMLGAKGALFFVIGGLLAHLIRDGQRALLVAIALSQFYVMSECLKGSILEYGVSHPSLTDNVLTWAPVFVPTFALIIGVLGYRWLLGRRVMLLGPMMFTLSQSQGDEF
jgi:hypothetical protein